MDPALVIAMLAGLGTVVAMFVGLGQMGWLGGEKRHVSTGIAAGIGEINEALQPQMPQVEQIQRLQDGEDEEDDEQGDPPVPGR